MRGRNQYSHFTMLYSIKKFLFQIGGIALLLTLTVCGDDKGITTSGGGEEGTGDSTATEQDYELVWSEEFNYEGLGQADGAIMNSSIIRIALKMPGWKTAF